MCHTTAGTYASGVPKLWNATIEAHRRDVRDAILDTAWRLATERGPLSVTMSQVAEEAGIGRATLYKYFPDVESILRAWHERQIAAHLEQLAQLVETDGDPARRLTAVLTRYADIVHSRGDHGAELAALLHRGEPSVGARQRLTDLMRTLLTEAAGAGQVRDDIPPTELALYCLHALGAAGTARSKAGLHRLVTLTLAGLRPPAPHPRDRDG